MTKVQTGLVIEFYSNSCLVRTKEHDIPCIGIKDVVVGDQVNIEIIQDSKKIRGVILSKEPRKSSLRKKENSKSKVIAANLSHVGILFLLVDDENPEPSKLKKHAKSNNPKHAKTAERSREGRVLPRFVETTVCRFFYQKCGKKRARGRKRIGKY